MKLIPVPHIERTPEPAPHFYESQTTADQLTRWGILGRRQYLMACASRMTRDEIDQHVAAWLGPWN
jgi:hypothetical protein